MANWLTHMILADRLLHRDLPLDARGFCIGSIAPDCNVENEDWTEFTPPRQVTHWMTGADKSLADHESFYRQHVVGRIYPSLEERSFWLGYYAHLVTDARYQTFIRDNSRVASSFTRLKANPVYAAKVAGPPETFDTLKKAFGKQAVFRDIAFLEAKYASEHPESCYLAILRKTYLVPDYPAFLPQGAIVRKIHIMAPEVPMPSEQPPLLFFTQQEYDVFLEGTACLILQKLKHCFDLS